MPPGIGSSALVAACVVALSGCHSPAEATADYLRGGAAARRLMETSLVNRAGGYARLRLEHYAGGGPRDWGRLREWNPPSAPIPASELDQPTGASPTALSGRAMPLALPRTIGSLDDAALRELGRQAFERYPTQLASYMRVGLRSRAAAARYGLWVDPDAGVGGLVRARMPDGSVALALTCATCHTGRRPNGELAPGMPNAALDLGRALLDAEATATETSSDPRAAWGPGRLDVTTATGVEPARIPDLRPVRWLTHLHQDATIRGADPITLAMRIETLIITSSSQTVRPPRVVALALAVYVRSLADGLPEPALAAAASPRGAALFADHCAACHEPPGFTGKPVRLAAVGTDPVLGSSAERGTGTYRVPSLRGVGTRGPLLHDGTIPSLAALLDPARLSPAFSQRLHGTGPVRGQDYGLALSDPDRQSLIAYLQHL